MIFAAVATAFVGASMGHDRRLPLAGGHGQQPAGRRESSVTLWQHRRRFAAALEPSGSPPVLSSRPEAELDKRKLSTKGREAAAPPKPRTLASGDAVGDKLRAMFQMVEAAPVPNEINRLVEELEKKRRQREP